MKKIFLLIVGFSLLLFGNVIEDAEDGKTDGWIVPSGGSIVNESNAEQSSRVIKFSSDSYQYYKMLGIDNTTASKIKWDMKIGNAFYFYIYVTTTKGTRLLYYNAKNSNYGLSGTAIHHGIGTGAIDNSWHTFERDIEADIKEYESDNELVSIDALRIFTIGEMYLDNLELLVDVSVDTIAPVITIPGESTERLLLNSTYTQNVATAVDNVDGNVSVNISGTVDTSKIGAYTITYSAVDTQGNKAIVKQTIKVYDESSGNFLLSQGFSGLEPTEYLKYKTSTSNQYSISNSNFSFSSEHYTEGTQSLKVDVSIPENGGKSWYYYLEIPLNPIIDLENNVSFSMDIKLEPTAYSHIEVGLNLPYYPTGSGIKRVSKLGKTENWQNVKIENIKQELEYDSIRWLNQYVYDASPDDIGRAVNSVLLLIKGKGALNTTFYLDDIQFSGEQLNSSYFETIALQRWSNYKKRVQDKIQQRINRRDSLGSFPSVDPSSLSAVQRERYEMAEANLARINEIISEMSLKLTSSYIAPLLMKTLDSLLNAYEASLVHYLEEESNANEKAKFYRMPTMKYNRLDGYNTPILPKAQIYNLRMTAGEYKSIAVLVSPTAYGSFEMNANSTDFIGKDNNLSKDILDLYIGKIWYQASLDQVTKEYKVLTQELLLKDDSLVKVDRETSSNLLKIKRNGSMNDEYINISDSTAVFPDTNSMVFNDSKVLKPFTLDAAQHKLVWGIIHIPSNAAAGDYNGTLEFKDSNNNLIKSININIEVLPFTLDASKLRYSLYYIGRLEDSAEPVDSHYKSEAQQLLELKDMKSHGVLYPSSYDSYDKLDKTLELRNLAGLPKDRFYTFALRADKYSMENIEDKVSDFQSSLNSYGYDSTQLYLYANEEILKQGLYEELESLRKVKATGANSITAGYNYYHDVVGDDLDSFIYHRGFLNKDAEEQVRQWHVSGKEIFAYSSPQGGIENPEIYRRNYGCKLWEKGFDGAFNWSYQAKRGAFWNDFDGSNFYREEAFTYPTTNGLVGTIEWEGFREAITDVRYLSTLENLKAVKSANGEDVSDIDNLLGGIDCDGDLDLLREQIIDLIIK